MKKIVTLVLAVALISMAGQTFAQSIGGKLGVNFAKVTGDGTDKVEMNTGLAAGVFINIPVVPSLLSIQPEILYSQKGFKVESELLGVNVTSKTWINYIEIPVMAKVTIPVVPIYAMAGPYVGYALNGKIDVNGTSEDIAGEDMDKRFDYGLNLGLGYEKGFGPVKVFLDARYGIGFANIIDSEDIKNSNSVISLTAGVRLGLF